MLSPPFSLCYLHLAGVLTGVALGISILCSVVSIVSFQGAVEIFSSALIGGSCVCGVSGAVSTWVCVCAAAVDTGGCIGSSCEWNEMCPVHYILTRA